MKTQTKVELTEEEINRVELALEMARFVHDTCEKVPHDIGLNLLKIVESNINLNISIWKT